MSNKMVVDMFPSTSEIIDVSATLSTCEVCRKQFQNTSACRLHRLKSHKIVDAEKLSDRRLSNRFEGDAVNYSYHCPVKDCSSKKATFDGMKSLRQHYFRAHTEKRFTCSCGFRSALEKDLKYHRKSRCRLRSEEDKSKGAKKASSGCPKQSEVPPQTSAQPTTTTVVHPIFLIVPTSDVQSVVNNIQQSLNSTNSSADIAIQTLPPPPPPPPPHPRHQAMPMMTTTTSQQPTTSYYDRGTSEIDQMAFYNPVAFNQHDYQNSDAYRHQPDVPQTRSFGTTMFDDVSTRHMGTSMDQEDYFNMMIRDTETQTTSQHPWEWRM